MKNFKRTLLLALILFAAFTMSFSACSGLPDNSDGITIKLIVLDLNSEKLYEKEHSTTKSSLYESFNEFAELQIEATTSFLGAYVNAVSIGCIEENEFGNYFKEEARIKGGPSELGFLFVGVYHSIDDIKYRDLSPYAEDLVYLGNTYFYSGVGVSHLPLNDGATYILKLASY